MNIGTISTIITIAKIAEPILTDLEAIATEAESNDTIKAKVESIAAQLDTLLQTIVKAF